MTDKKGKVYIVGAGPGDPDLITVKAMKCLEKADVILYDRLVNPLLLNYANADTEFIYCGKEPGNHCVSQDSIHQLLVEKALAGKWVVRLKGGDPFIFGRGGEEAEVLVRNSID
ncbi:MAG: uroporphyrinogen-III C-methyltransferase, partial [Bacillus sp. (in: firmicutes)]